MTDESPECSECGLITHFLRDCEHCSTEYLCSKCLPRPAHSCGSLADELKRAIDFIEAHTPPPEPEWSVPVVCDRVVRVYGHQHGHVVTYEDVEAVVQTRCYSTMDEAAAFVHNYLTIPDTPPEPGEATSEERSCLMCRCAIVGDIAGPPFIYCLDGDVIFFCSLGCRATWRMQNLPASRRGHVPGVDAKPELPLAGDVSWACPYCCQKVGPGGIFSHERRRWFCNIMCLNHFENGAPASVLKDRMADKESPDA